MKTSRICSLAAAAVFALSTMLSSLPFSVTGYAAEELPITKYIITEEELSAAGVEWQGSTELTVYARVTEGGMDSRMTTTTALGPEGVGKTSWKCLSGRNVLVGNAIQDDIIGLAGTGLYAFPAVKLQSKTQDGSEWSESYNEEVTITITIETADTDMELLGIEFGNGAVYAYEEGFSPETIVTESPTFDVIVKTARDYLEMSIDHCSALDSTKYQAESLEQLQEAIAEARAVYETEEQADEVYNEARAALEKVRARMLFTETGTPESPLPYRELTAEELVYEMGAGINLGNTLDGHSHFAPSETSWQSVVTTKAYIKALHDAGYNTVRIPVTWGATIDRETYEIDEKWMDRVQEIVDYCISQDMYAIINIHHDGAEQSGWLRVASDEIDSVYEKFECVWRNIAERFKDYDEHLIFESMNEITCMKDDMKNSQEAVDKDTPVIVDLNQIFVNVVRSTGSNNEKRWLAAVAHYANSGNHKEFVLPTDVTETPHIMFAAHIYKANTNTTWTYDEIYQVVNGLKMMADKFDVPMYLGEYGNRTQTQEGTETGYNDIARAYFSEIVHRACQTAGVVPVVWDQGYGEDGKYQTGLFTYWDRELCVPLFESITDAMMRGTYLPNSELNDSWDYTDVIEGPEIIPISGISLETNKISLAVGERTTIAAETSPANSNDVLLWTTDDDTVATVSPMGLIHATGIGTTTIRARTQNSDKTAEIKLTVTAAQGENKADSVLAPEELTIKTDTSMLLGAALPEGAEGTLSYKTSNPNIITVSPTGRIFAVDSGVAYVMVTADSGASATVRVVSQKGDTAPETGAASLSYTGGNGSITINAVGDVTELKLGTGEAGSVISFASDNSAVAAVNSPFAVVANDSGIAAVPITAMSVGTATITARAENGSSLVFEVSVLNEASEGGFAWWIIALIAAAAVAAATVILVAVKRFARKKNSD